MQSSEHLTNATGTPSSTPQGKIEALYSLEFAVRKSIRYHSKRRKFFDSLDYFTKCVTTLTGSSAFVALLPATTLIVYGYPLALILTAIVAFFSTCDLVFGFSKKSQLHDGLQRKFSALLRLILLNNPTDDLVRKWQAERIEIEQDEPTHLTLLTDVCHNEEAIALDRYDYVLAGIKGWRSYLINWFSFDNFHNYLVSRNNIPTKPRSLLDHT